MPNKNDKQQKARVARLTKGYAQGGAVRGDLMLNADRHSYDPDPEAKEGLIERPLPRDGDKASGRVGHPAETPRYGQGEASSERPPQWLRRGGAVRSRSQSKKR